LDWRDDGVCISANCVGCGRCAAVCPTGALEVAGFAPPASLAGADSALYLECQRVPAALRHAGAQVIPCLGGLTPLQLIEWVAQGRTPVLLDHGWCAACPAGAAMAPTTAEALDEAALDLRSVAGDIVDLPHLQSAPLPASKALPATAAAPAGPALGRRAFFATLRGGAPAVVAANRPTAWRATRSACRPSAQIQAARKRRANALEHVARRAGNALSAAAFPVLRAHDACTHEGVCAAACPSGALASVERADGSVGLDFEAASCVGCGLCVRLCPHDALSLTQAGDASLLHDPAPRTLTRHALASCTKCDASFVALAGAALCPRCAAAKAQARDLFGSLFTHRAAPTQTI
jgi:ferredoxin